MLMLCVLRVALVSSPPPKGGHRAQLGTDWETIISHWRVVLCSAVSSRAGTSFQPWDSLSDWTWTLCVQSMHVLHMGAEWAMAQQGGESIYHCKWCPCQSSCRNRSLCRGCPEWIYTWGVSWLRNSSGRESDSICLGKRNNSERFPDLWKNLYITLQNETIYLFVCLPNVPSCWFYLLSV